MASSSSKEKASDVNDLEELQSEVNAMATEIMECRSTLAELLKSRFASLLEARRPVAKLPASSALVGKDGALNNSEVESDNETADEIGLLKQKMSSNASAMTIVLKRMNDCMARIDKLAACNFTVDPVFKKKRIE